MYFTHHMFMFVNDEKTSIHYYTMDSKAENSRYATKDLTLDSTGSFF